MNIATTIFHKSLKLLAAAFLLQGWSAQAQNNTYQWVKQIGGSSQDNGYGVATDSKGNVYATGYFQNKAYIGLPGAYDSITAAGSFEVFLTKMDKDGNLLWAHPIGGTASDEGHAVTVDRNDQVIVTGSYRGTVNFDKGNGNTSFTSNNGSVDVFVAKYDSTGSFLWAQAFGSSNLDRAYSVKTDDQNNVFITGQFFDTVSIPGLNINLIATPSNGAVFTNDVFVCKLNASGNFVWAKSFGGPAGDVGASLATDSRGDVIILGSFNGNVDFDPGNGSYMMDADSGKIFITKLDATGTFVWARQLSANYNQGHFLETDAYNNIYVTGEFSGKSDFNLSPLPADTFFLTSDLSPNSSNHSNDGFVLKINSDAAFQWVKKIGGSGAASGRGITTDVTGLPYVVGTFSGDMLIDTTRYTSKGSTDVFIFKLDTAGQTVWTTRYGGSGAEFSRAIATDPFNAVYTAGHFVTTISGRSNFHNGNDTVSFNVIGGYDAYVHKIGCSDTNLILLQHTACNQYEFAGQTLTQGGTYTFHFWSEGGCDSTTVLDLTINYIDKPFITVNNFTLGVTAPYATYQWLKNGTLIPNATQATLTVNENADYTVIVTTTAGCTDTSDRYTVDNATSVAEHSGISINVQPNPVQDYLHIESPVTVQYYLTAITGKRLTPLSRYEAPVSCSHLTPGIYLLHILDDNDVLIKIEKIVKQ